MTVDSMIRTAITPTVPICVPNVYTGTSTEFCTFTYQEIVDGRHDNTASALRYLITVNYICANGYDCSEKRKAIRKALHDAGFTIPDVVNTSDSDSQQYTFECEYIDGEIFPEEAEDDG